MLGTQELILIFIIVLLLFGASKLPELARSLGNAIKEFKKVQSDMIKTDSDLKDKK